MLLQAAEVLVIAAPLTHATSGRIGARELALLPEDAILVNLARGGLIESLDVLYEALESGRLAGAK